VGNYFYHTKYYININIYNIINLGTKGGRADLAGRRSAIISQCLWHSTEVDGELLLARELEQVVNTMIHKKPNAIDRIERINNPASV
jgi:hypothetical protein